MTLQNLKKKKTYTGAVNVGNASILLLAPLQEPDTQCQVGRILLWHQNQSVDHRESNLQNGVFLWADVADN